MEGIVGISEWKFQAQPRTRSLVAVPLRELGDLNTFYRPKLPKRKRNLCFSEIWELNYTKF